MRFLTWRRFALAALLPQFGCAAPPGHTALIGPAPNLVLSHRPEINALAPQMAHRSLWPFADRGYYLDDVTEFSRISIDDQVFFDHDGGGHIRTEESVRTGIFLRP